MKKKQPEKQTLDFKRKSINFVKELFQVLIIVLFITSSIVEASRVPTGSMEKTIYIGDFLLVNKFIYGPSTPRYIPYTNVRLPYFRLPAFSEPERNDIIVFEFPGYREQITSEELFFYVKRCVGTPGDTLQIKNKVLFVNGEEFPIPPNIRYEGGKPLPADVEDPNIFPVNSGWNGDQYGPLVVPKEGDVLTLTPKNISKWKTFINREYEKSVVTVRDNQVFIEGQPVDKYTVKKDYYFMMGDNRDNSLDGRYWGFVPRENILGTPFIVFWSWDSNIPFSNPISLLASIRFDRIAKLIY